MQNPSNETSCNWANDMEREERGSSTEQRRGEARNEKESNKEEQTRAQKDIERDGKGSGGRDKSRK